MKDIKAQPNGLVGKLDEDTPFVEYCNEKEYKGSGFLLKCTPHCKHNIHLEKDKD